MIAAAWNHPANHIYKSKGNAIPVMSNLNEFRQRVIEIASGLFPGLEFQPSPDQADTILADGTQLGLQNIRAKFQLSDQSEEVLRELITNHFGNLLSAETPSLDDLSLEEIRDRLFPQIMPSDFTGIASIQLVSFPFASGIRVGIVADFPHTYMYLRQSELERWKVTPDEIHEMAVSNLNRASRNLEIQGVTDEVNSYLAVTCGDGYDAARILVPGLQSLFASQLGETFRFAIPNRDFLICWGINCDNEFHASVSKQVAQDYKEQPYPLSPSVFVRNSEGNIHEQVQSH